MQNYAPKMKQLLYVIFENSKRYEDSWEESIKRKSFLPKVIPYL